MKYFGEYLVAKNVINEEQLVIALIEQMKLSAPIPVIANNLLLFSHQEFLQIFKYQTENKLEFIQACKSLNLWTLDISNKIEAQLTKNRPPLGQVIVNLGFSNIEILTKSLDEFLSKIEKPNLHNINSNTSTSTNTNQNEIIIQKSENIPPSSTNLDLSANTNSQIDMEFGEELKQQMREIQKQEILDLFQALLNTKDESAAMEIVTMIHTFKGISKLAGANLLANLLDLTEKALLHLKTRSNDPNWNSGLTLINQAVESIFYIKNYVIKNQSEDILTSDQILHSLIKKTRNDMETVLTI